jgi:hypothetical protein
MRHALIGLRAFGEAVFWGTVGGGAWGLLLGVSFGGLEEGEGFFYLVLISAAIGLMVGLLVGVVGAFVAAGLSLWGVSDRICRVVAGAVSGICVAGALWLFFGREDTVLGTWLEGPREWFFLVVGPGLAAVAMGAWRGPVVLRSAAPRLRRQGDVVA